jgi:predicted GIY-YIG superfamily endonuclease
LLNELIFLPKLKEIITLEQCKNESKKYINKTEFKIKSYKYFRISKINGWLEDICKLYKNSKSRKHCNIKWTFEKCKEVAEKCASKSEFKNRFFGAYKRYSNQGWLEDICSHMIKIGNKKKRCIYSYEFSDNSVYVGLTYNINERHIQHMDGNKKRTSSVYKHMIKTGLIPLLKKLTDYLSIEDSINLEEKYVKYYSNLNWNILNKKKTGDLGGNILKWTFEKCQEEAKKYKFRSEYQIKNRYSYEIARKNKWLNEICKNMKKKPHNLKWTFDECKETALKM